MNTYIVERITARIDRSQVEADSYVEAIELAKKHDAWKKHETFTEYSIVENVKVDIPQVDVLQTEEV